MQTGAALSAEDAQTVATNIFNANASTAIASRGAFTPLTTVISSGVVTTTASYQGATPTLLSGVLNRFGRLFGIGHRHGDLGSLASGSIDGDTGEGALWGDPHIGGMDGNDFYITCSLPAGSWYNYYSDMKFEINISCYNWFDTGVSLVGAVTVLFGPHVLSMSSSPALTLSSRNMTYNSNAYYGNFILDGVNYPAVQNINWVTAYKDADYEVDVHVVTTAPSDGITSSG